VHVKSVMPMQPRFNHSSAMFGSTLLLFGGMNTQMHLTKNVEEIELNRLTVDKRVAL